MGLLILILILLCLSIVTAFISEASLKNVAENFTSFIMHGVICFVVLLISSFFFIFAVLGINHLSRIFSRKDTLHTPEDFSLLALWFMIQAIICAIIIICTRLIACRKKNLRFHFSSGKQKREFCALLFFPLAVLAIAMSFQVWSETQLILNEIQSQNTVDTGDYIELYNPTPFNLKLSDFYVTDDLEKQPKQVSADDVIPAKSYTIIQPGEGENSFAVSNDGDEVIYLLNGDKTVIDSVMVPVLKNGQVYARNDSGSGWGIYDPSPMTGNTGNEIKPVSAPVFSAESGFFDEPFTLTISAQDDCKIYYTIDSSLPDETSILYEDGIEIKNASDEPNVYKSVQNVRYDWDTYTPSSDLADKAAIIRAVAIDEDNNRSDVVTKTYFIDLAKYQDQFVLSLVSLPDDLFGEDGIYVTGREYDEWYFGDQEGSSPDANFSQRGIDYEIETNIEMFCNNLLFSQSAGLRIQGDSSRNYAVKGFKLYSRKRYSGSYYFDYDIFEQPVHSFSVRVGNRNDGFADAFMESLIQDRDIGGKQAIPVSVFLDGEFWADYYLTEIYSEDYIAQKFNVNPSEITIMSSIPDEIYDFLAEHDLSKEEDYLLFCELVDIQNYIDFMVDTIYLCNMDWSETKNVKIWKTDGNSGMEYDDGKWRFLVHDMDAASWNNEYGYYGIDSYGINSFSSEKRYAGAAFDQEPIFSAFMKNEDFCRQFVLTFMDFANTYFEKNTVEKQLIEWGEDLTWCDSFFEKRFDYIVPDLAEEFQLTGTLETITLKTSPEGAGTITINTVTPELTGGEWSGSYYTDYPVSLYASPAEGYEFIGWKHGDEFYTDPAVEAELNENDNVWEAEFIKK